MSDLERVLEKLEDLGEGLAALQEAMGMLLEAWSPPTVPPPVPAKAPIASYAQMYGPIEAAPVTPPPPPPTSPQSGRLRRWLTKEEGA
jgi:hypothetical protein